jgi:CheY-like chemotaxis protein
VPQAVRSDPVRFRQVLANLVENAVKYTDDGWVVVSVGYTEPGSRRGELLVSVQDTGPGIPEEDTERIFDRFSRLSYTSATSSGAGLGLTISKALVEMMGGSLWCESRLEQGSTFRMRLPVNTPRNGGHLQQGPATTAAVSASEGLRVLVAEDDRVNRVFISHLLRRFGHEPTPVTDGKEALEKLGEGAFDVVLMDVQMPNMNGVEATEAIRASHWAAWRDLPIVAMTAYVGPEHEAEFAAAGMNATLTKPLDAADLQRVLAHAVPQRTLS